MPIRRRRRSLVLLAAATAVGAALSLQGPLNAGAAQSSATTPYTGPTGAARVYLWGPAHWHDEYEQGMVPQYAINPRPSVENRYGMLTLKGRPDGRMVRVTLQRQSYRYGRWEIRVRVRPFNDRPLPFHMVAELVPSGGQYRCGARNITLADYSQGDRRASMRINTLPNRSFTFSKRPVVSPGGWNTYAVEITRSHISWFVDDRVVMTERRPAALSGAAYTLRYRFVTPAQSALTQPWMQMDWSRYFTLKRPNALPISAPRTTAGTNRRAC